VVSQIAPYFPFDLEKVRKTRKKGLKRFGIIAYGVWPAADPKYQNVLPRTAAYLPIEIQA